MLPPSFRCSLEINAFERIARFAQRQIERQRGRRRRRRRAVGCSACATSFTPISSLTAVSASVRTTLSSWSNCPPVVVAQSIYAAVLKCAPAFFRFDAAQQNRLANPECPRDADQARHVDRHRGDGRVELGVETTLRDELGSAASRAISRVLYFSSLPASAAGLSVPCGKVADSGKNKCPRVPGKQVERGFRERRQILRLHPRCVRFAGQRIGLVHEARAELGAAPRLRHHHERGLQVRHALEPLLQFRHDRGAAERCQHQHRLGLRLAALQGASDRREELLQRDRLFEEIVRAVARGLTAVSIVPWTDIIPPAW